MRGGKLRNYVNIEAKSTSESCAAEKDAYGRPILVNAETWQCWREDLACGVEHRRGQEIYDAVTGQRYQMSYTRFTFRLDAVVGLTPGEHRIVFQGQIYDIRNAMPDEQRR